MRRFDFTYSVSYESIVKQKLDVNRKHIPDYKNFKIINFNGRIFFGQTTYYFFFSKMFFKTLPYIDLIIRSLYINVCVKLAIVCEKLLFFCGGQ